MFTDRKEAGLKLAGVLKKMDIKDPIVLAIPRGGVEVGYYVAAPVSGPGMENSLQNDLAGSTRLELATSGVTGQRSNQAELRPRMSHIIIMRNSHSCNTF